MNRTSVLLQCPNPTCLHDANVAGQSWCERCQTPLCYRYVWAVGDVARQVPTNVLVGDRYYVIAPQVWLDTQPALLPEGLDELPPEVRPYFKLYSHRLHVPVVYGFCQLEPDTAPVMLLEHAPIDRKGQVQPAIETAWEQATAVRQVYWLWQLLELWHPLKEANASLSLLIPGNVRVEGWRVRLQELLLTPLEGDRSPMGASTGTSLRDLSAVWAGWVARAQPEVIAPLQQICQQMQSDQPSQASFQTIRAALNQLLLEQAALLPLKLTVAGATTSGPQRSHNEDACYPLTIGIQPPTNDPLIPNLAIICDGIGGHAGGEVASQMALRSLQLQVLALLAEVAEGEVSPPEVIAQQLEAIARVVNNVIAEQNNAQGREARQRMGTTLIMAVQIPQSVPTPTGVGNAHELYLVNVGDSRAYWLTADYCHTLTVDDDVTSREVRLGRSLYREALRRSDSGALTQAIGTRDGTALYPTVRRFVLEEDGLLLLCSDGLSDGDRVEQYWEDITTAVLKGKTTLEDAVEFWTELANQQNGHDNTSVVMVQCRISPEPLQVFDPSRVKTADQPLESELSESSRALLYDSDPERFNPVVSEPPAPAKEPDTASEGGPSLNYMAIAFGMAVLMFLAGAVGISVWRNTDPTGFQRTFDQIFQPQQRP